MKQYIDKDALVAEIEKLKKSHDNWSYMGKRFHQEYEKLLSFINTLEVKEVDLEKEIDNYLDGNFYISETWGIFSEKTENEINRSDLEDVAKHFFELGLKAQKGE